VVDRHIQQHSRGGPVPLGQWTGLPTVRAFLPIRGCMKHPEIMHQYSIIMRSPRARSDNRADILPTLGLVLTLH